MLLLSSEGSNHIMLNKCDKPAEAPLWKSFHLCPDRTTGRQLNTHTQFVHQFVSRTDQRSDEN